MIQFLASQTENTVYCSEKSSKICNCGRVEDVMKYTLFGIEDYITVKNLRKIEPIF